MSWTIIIKLGWVEDKVEDFPCLILLHSEEKTRWEWISCKLRRQSLFLHLQDKKSTPQAMAFFLLIQEFLKLTKALDLREATKFLQRRTPLSSTINNQIRFTLHLRFNSSSREPLIIIQPGSTPQVLKAKKPLKVKRKRMKKEICSTSFIWACTKSTSNYMRKISRRASK